MKRILILAVAVCGLLVCAPADAGCGRFRLPNPVKWLKARKEARAAESVATCAATVTLHAVPRESAGVDPTVLQWAGPMAGSPCASGQCSPRRRK